VKGESKRGTKFRELKPVGPWLIRWEKIRNHNEEGEDGTQEDFILTKTRGKNSNYIGMKMTRKTSIQGRAHKKQGNSGPADV